MERSYTTTAYGWLFRDSHPSLRTLWSAVIKSPNFSARRRASPVRFLHGALVVLVLWQISQFRSLGNEYKHCASLILIPLSLDVPIPSHQKCVRLLALLCHQDFLRSPPTIQEHLANGRPNLDCHSCFFLSVSGGRERRRVRSVSWSWSVTSLSGWTRWRQILRCRCCFLHGVLVILVLWQISQFRSLGKWV